MVLADARWAVAGAAGVVLVASVATDSVRLALVGVLGAALLSFPLGFAAYRLLLGLSHIGGERTPHPPRPCSTVATAALTPATVTSSALAAATIAASLSHHRHPHRHLHLHPHPPDRAPHPPLLAPPLPPPPKKPLTPPPPAPRSAACTLSLPRHRPRRRRCLRRRLALRASRRGPAPASARAPPRPHRARLPGSGRRHQPHHRLGPRRQRRVAPAPRRPLRRLRLHGRPCAAAVTPNPNPKPHPHPHPNPNPNPHPHPHPHPHP